MYLSLVFFKSVNNKLLHRISIYEFSVLIIALYNELDESDKKKVMHMDPILSEDYMLLLFRFQQKMLFFYGINRKRIRLGLLISLLTVGINS